MKLLEKIAIGALVVVLILVIIAIAIQNSVVVNVAFVLLAVTAMAYTVAQVGQYLGIMGESTKESKSLLIIMITSVVVALVVIVLAILVLAGKLTF